VFGGLLAQIIPGRGLSAATVAIDDRKQGAGEHTHAGGLGRAHEAMFDWLDVTLAA
jgi:hypothetical protein